MRFFHMLLSLFLLLPYVAFARELQVANVNADGADDDSDVDDDDGSLRKLGQRCGRNNICLEGLDCVPAPILKKCFPIGCAIQAVTAAMNETSFDLATYGNERFAGAGVDTKSSDMFRRFPDNHLNAVNTESSSMKRLMEDIKSNPPPLDLISEKFSKCTKQNVEGYTPYFGASWGLGLLGTYNGDIFWGQGTEDTEQVATLNNCFGALLGFDAGITGLLGLAFTGRLKDVQDGCKYMFPILETGPVGIEIGFVDCEDPIYLIELTAGFSAGFGLPGVTTCTTTDLNEEVEA